MPPQQCRNSAHVTILRIVIARLLKNLRVEERGQDMVEYGLLLSFMVALALAVVTSLRGQLSTIWSGVSSAVSSAAS